MIKYSLFLAPSVFKVGSFSFLSDGIHRPHLSPIKLGWRVKTSSEALTRSGRSKKESNTQSQSRKDIRKKVVGSHNFSRGSLDFFANDFQPWRCWNSHFVLIVLLKQMMSLLLNIVYRNWHANWVTWWKKVFNFFVQSEVKRVKKEWVVKN